MLREISSITDVLEIASRRKWNIILPAVSVFLIAAAVALAIPKTYRSSATILIEAQEVPSEYVKANISSYADQRMHSINQQIMGAPRLLELITRLNLYADLKSKLTMDEIVEKMRKDIKFLPISADVVDPRSGRPAQATIAFSVSFQGRNPEVVQLVASELASLYVAENLKDRDKQSAGTSRFLQDEMRNIKENLSGIERRIAAFKQKNIESLPELSQVNMQAFDQVDREIRLLNDQLRTAKEKEQYLQTELAGLPRELPSNDQESLRQLKLRLTDLKSRFSDQYPDVKKTLMEIRELEAQMKAKGDAGNGRADNPAYVTLASQLAGTRSDIELLRRQIAAMTAKRESYQRRISVSPRVEEGYKTILVERNNLQQKYDDLARKALEANVAHGMEKEQLGERFTIVDPARRPERPSSPNVAAIMLLGLLAGTGAGLVVAIVRELGDDTVRLSEELAAVAGLTVLATIPEILNGADLARQRKRKVAALTAAAAVACAAVFLFHLFVMDLGAVLAGVGRVLTR